ncbi:hypothetical protein KR51_00000050 [Rubidibacter lacunae KORDI 51-2]|uniref:Uncharacterized protein n=1 Tax=Rubidibacter lacunae KORDI 51-2 TaxID=582515 RepID=U5DQM2_9CHRO|nr:hypothetical protein [Rubidibacter lacunae]ERN43117.1 hypothetical protein KR51_00000050 [Rubidibacter lacunae KORDI 51-2]
MQDSKAIERLRKGSLYSFIVFLSVSALLAIFIVLTGGFNWFKFKVLITTSIIAVASICSLCCGAYSTRVRSSFAGVSGIVLAGFSAAMHILATWVDISSEGYWKTASILSIYAIAYAHALALLAIRLRPAHSWLQHATAANIFILATIVAGQILSEADNEGIFKLIIVLAILVTLETLVIPILWKLAKGTHHSIKEVLSLTRREDGTYEDERGCLYEVKEVS